MNDVFTPILKDIFNGLQNLRRITNGPTNELRRRTWAKAFEKLVESEVNEEATFSDGSVDEQDIEIEVADDELRGYAAYEHDRDYCYLHGFKGLMEWEVVGIKRIACVNGVLDLVLEIRWIQ